MSRRSNAKLAEAPTLGDLRAPLYHQIFLILRNKIVGGEYPDGAFLPSEAEVASAFNVSRITAKRALNEIAEAGLAVRQRGRGTRVRYQGGGTIVSGGVQGLIDSLRANSRTPAKVLEFDYVASPAEVASALRIAPGTIVQRAVRVFADDSGLPYSHLTTFVPAALGKKWTANDLRRHALTALIERAGAALEFAEQIITATLADAQVAAALRVDFGTPLLRVVRTMYTKAETPAEHLIALYPSDRYRFIMSLSREADSARWQA
jgi:GntR family transcriptional regulator